jgi:hypothetical protein
MVVSFSNQVSGMESSVSPKKKNKNHKNRKAPQDAAINTARLKSEVRFPGGFSVSDSRQVRHTWRPSYSVEHSLQ